MNKIEIQFEFFGTWHVGLRTNNEFVKYFSNQHLVHEFNNNNLDIELIFLGKDHYRDEKNFVKINKIYYNNLMLDSLVNKAIFNTDNDKYKVIRGCNYINLNGIWHLRIDDNIVTQELRNYLE